MTEQDLYESAKYVFVAEIEFVKTVTMPESLKPSVELANRFTLAALLRDMPNVLKYGFRLVAKRKGELIEFRHVYVFPTVFCQMHFEPQKQYEIYLNEKPIVSYCGGTREIGSTTSNNAPNSDTSKAGAG